MALPISKGPKRGIYYAQCRYKGRSGESKKKVKRRLKTEKEVCNWEYELLEHTKGAPSMLFSESYEAYAEDAKT